MFEVLSDGLPKMSEHASRSCEVQTCQVAVLEDHFSSHGSFTGHHVDDAVREASSLKNFHDDLGAVDLCVRWLPNHDIPHQCRHGWKVAGNGGEVEGSDGKHKSLEGPVFKSVPKPVRAFRLLCMDFLRIVGIEAKEICKFTRRIDFSLEAVLSLRKHGGGVDFGPVRSCHKIGCLQENGRPMLPAQGRPSWSCFKCSIDGLLDMFLGAIAEVAQHFPMFMGRAHRLLVRRCDALGSDVHGDLDWILVVHGFVSGLKRLAFRRTRSIAQDRFIDGIGYVESSVGHCE